MEEVRRLGSLQDEEINKAKEVLAFEVTKLIHGEEEAKKLKKLPEHYLVIKVPWQALSLLLK